MGMRKDRERNRAAAELRYRAWLATLSEEDRCEVERLSEMTFRAFVVRALVVVAIMCAVIAITMKTLP